MRSVACRRQLVPARCSAHRRDAIEVHLTVGFAALALSRHIQDIPGIRRIVRMCRPLCIATIRIDKHTVAAASLISSNARDILNRLPPINAPGH